MQILSGGRFRLGLGSGESLNEHVVGMRWPTVGERHEMLAEAVDVISALFAGGNVNVRGKHFAVESAQLGTCRRSACRSASRSRARRRARSPGARPTSWSP